MVINRSFWHSSRVSYLIKDSADEIRGTQERDKMMLINRENKRFSSGPLNIVFLTSDK